jgi:hypothetical protein
MTININPEQRVALEWLSEHPGPMPNTVPIGGAVRFKGRRFDWLLWLTLHNAGLIHMRRGADRAEVWLSELGRGLIEGERR